MNPKQKKVIKLIAEGKSQTAAYKEAYGVKDDKIAAPGASNLLRNPKVQNALQEALRRKGIDEDSIADSLLELKHNRDWKAKESFIDRVAKFHSYDQAPTQLTQVNIGSDMGVKITTYDPDRATQESEGNL